MLRLASYYEVGQAGVPQDGPKAIAWYQKVAASGNTEALFLIGNIYYEGLGVKKDYAQSLQWFAQAAEKGHVGAMFVLGMIYGSGGYGLEPNAKLAAEWTARARASKSKD